MPREYNRTDRIADVMQRELARLIQYEMHDPRLKTLVTVAAVKVTRDLGHAKVYVTVLADEQQAEEAVKLLNHAAGFLRTQLAQYLTLRTVPQLLFIYDKTLLEGNRLSGLIDQAMQRSEEKPDSDK